MKVVIDHDRCTGHGRCYVLADSLITDDDAGYGQVVSDGTIPDGQLAMARRAVEACPEQAITIEQ